jgi:hypothetical protein
MLLLQLRLRLQKLVLLRPCSLAAVTLQQNRTLETLCVS